VIPVASEIIPLGARLRQPREDAAQTESLPGRYPGPVFKRLPTTEIAPSLALNTSELVIYGVRHTDSEWSEIDITLGTARLRIEMSDQRRSTIRPRTPDLDGGWGLTLVGELATRGGVERLDSGEKISVELDRIPAV
jgi:hypothetical protein